MNRERMGEVRLVERRVSYKVPDAFADGGEAVVFYGTADAIIIHPPGAEAELVDFKSGAGGNHREQLAGYALALFSERKRLKRIRCHVLYGRTQHADCWTLDRAQAAATALPIIEARQAEHREPHAGDYCQYCANRMTCPAVTGMVQAVTDGGADLLAAIREPGAVTNPDQMARLMDMAGVLATWTKTVKDAALAMAQAGADLPGYRLSERRGTQSIEDIPAAAQRLGLDSEQMLTACKVSIPTLAKMYATAQGLKPKAARHEMETLLGDLLAEGKPSYSITKYKG
jgi:hypothetical protein